MGLSSSVEVRLLFFPFTVSTLQEKCFVNIVSIIILCFFDSVIRLALSKVVWLLSIFFIFNALFVDCLISCCLIILEQCWIELEQGTT